MAVVAGLICLQAGGVAAAEDAITHSVTISDAWAPATAPGARTAAVYLTLANRGDADVLLHASSSAAGKVEFHTHVHRDGMMTMTELPSVDVPTDGILSFEPHGDHLMLIGLVRPLAPGDEVTVTLEFRDAGRMEFHAEVRDIRR